MNFTCRMRPLFDTIKVADAENKDGALTQCLLTISQLSGSEIATAILLTQFASTVKGTLTMEDS
jgi:hypothetical protein